MLLLFPFSCGVHYLLCFAYLQMKLQAKEEISSLYDSRLSPSSLRKENIPSDEERGETAVI